VGKALGGVLFNLNGTVTIQDSSIAGNGNAAGSGNSVYNLSHNGGNTASGQTPLTTLHLLSTSVSTANGDLVNNQTDGTAIVIGLTNLTQTYTGSPLTPTLTTIPAGSNVVLTGAPQTNAGTYPVTATVTAGNYTDSVTTNFVIGKAAATVTLGNLSQTYTGNPLTPGATTVPAGLNVTLSGAPQTNAGSYPVTATINDGNYQGSTTGTFVIAMATPTITLGNLTQTYTGGPLTPSAVTVPAGLNVVFTGVPQTNAGSYSVTGTVSDPNATSASASGTFVIAKATAPITFSGLNTTFNGTAQSPTVTTVPAGLAVQLTGVPKISAGSYPVTATINDPNYQGSASGTFVIARAPATVTLSNLTQTYTGAALSPTVTTVPAGLSFGLVGAPKTNAGSYSVTAQITNPDYQGSASGTFVINQAPATVTLGNLTQIFSGTALSPTITTTPAGLSVALSGAPATNVSTYPVTATVTDKNYTGSASGTFVINPLNITGTITAIAQYYANGTWSSSNPKPAACANVSGTCQAYSDLIKFTVTVPAVVGSQNVLTPVTCNTATGTVTAPCVNFAIGSKSYGPVALTPSGSNLTGTITTGLTNAANLAGGTHSFGAITPVGGGNSNISMNATGSLTAVVEDAYVTYTGLRDLTTTSTAATQNVPVSYTLQDPSALSSSSSIYDPAGGKIQQALLTFTLAGSSPAGSFTGSCTPQFGTLVNGNTAVGTEQCVIANVPVNGTYTLTASASNLSSYKPVAGDVTVTLTNGNDGAGSIQGNGSQTAQYLEMADRPNGKYKAFGLITPAAGTNLEFNFQGKYQKKGIRAEARILIESKPLMGIPGYTPNPGNDGLCKYEIRSKDIESLTIEPPFEKWASTATIEDVTQNGNHGVMVAENVQLQMVMHVDTSSTGKKGHGHQENDSTLSIQVTDDINGLWFSNNWTGVTTAVSEKAPLIQEGKIMLH
jgi:uncharacterized protein with FMN-binding domain